MAAITALGVSVVAQATGAPKIMVNDDVIQENGFPRVLARYGFFQDGGAREASDNVHAYELNTPLWSDGADKLRYIYLPEGAQLKADGDGLLQFPVGSAIIKTFAYGEGDDQRFIETRVLLHRADGWLALPYRWNDEQTEAKLAIAGDRIPITTASGEEISYRIPNKNQCKTCHSVDGEVIPIGPKARNLSAKWLGEAYESGRLDRVPEGADTLPFWTNTSVSKDARVRAYLDVNCAHCHRPGGGASNSGLDLSWEQTDTFAIGINKPPVAAGRGAGGLLVSIEPGKPEKSILVHRMNSNEPGIAMPELGRSTIDHEAVELMRDWISEMSE
ncbi:MAG: SO2930 family diheme c-type cytochrome [Erythrobacter sp.]|uniref:SO2930 family diheme c-type cytochrome n=1 Tax=Erythrobacter sp. TaxID=1042 RepID=UPI003264E466